MRAVGVPCRKISSHRLRPMQMALDGPTRRVKTASLVPLRWWLVSVVSARLASSPSVPELELDPDRNRGVSSVAVTSSRKGPSASGEITAVGMASGPVVGGIGPEPMMAEDRR